MTTSLVITILNEEKTIEWLLKSILRQTKKPHEVIITDAGSTDKTVKIIKKWTKQYHGRGIELFCFVEKGVNRAKGRNMGVAKSGGEIIAFTDAGCVLDGNWLRKITMPFKDPNVDVVAGYYKAMAKDVFEKCLALYVLAPQNKMDLPSSRSMAIRREVFLRTGGFPEACDYSEDYAYGKILQKNGYKIVFAEKAIVWWLSPTGWQGITAMFFNQARDDVRSGVFRKKVLLIPLKLLVFPVWALIKNYRHLRGWREIFWLPVIEFIADTSVIAGTITGIITTKSLQTSQVSVVVLTQPNDKNLARCLTSVSWADEIIIIIDADDSRELLITTKRKTKVFYRPLNGNFSSQRNFGRDMATNEWVFFLDSDETASPLLEQELKKKLAVSTADGYYIRRRDFFLGKWLSWGEAGKQYLLRIVRKNRGAWTGFVHEHWETDGETEVLKNGIDHYSHDSLTSFFDKIGYYSTLRARELKLNGAKKQAWKIVVYPLAKFCLNYFWRLGFLDGTRGFIHAAIMSFHSFLVRAKLYRSF